MSYQHVVHFVERTGGKSLCGYRVKVVAMRSGEVTCLKCQRRISDDAQTMAALLLGMKKK